MVPEVEKGPSGEFIGSREFIAQAHMSAVLETNFALLEVVGVNSLDDI